jgi:curved DNA-binding protein
VSTRARDPYDVLGVARDASQDEIRRAYRRLARTHHPDVSKEPDAEARFKDISEAYDTIGDPEKRAAYDRRGEAFAGGRREYGEEIRFEDVEDMFGDGGIGDLFGDLFRRRGAGGPGVAMRGPDFQAALEIGLEEAARGGRRRIDLGGGRSLEVEIPRGVTDGQRIRLAGQGGPGIGGGPPGDLYLEIHLRPHPRFRVEGRDLHVQVPVSPADAALGATVEVPILGGVARTKVPAGSSSGRRLRLRGKGLPNPSGPDGDLYAEVRIVVPRTLNEDEREAYERLRRASRSSAGSEAA